MRSIIIGDVHGCLDELDALLAVVAPGAGDRLCFLGDLVDRGPDSVGVVRRVRALLDAFPGSVAIAGNHEEKALHRRERGTLEAPWGHAADDRDWAFLDGLPPFARLEAHGALLVHGGLYPRFFDHHPTLGEAPRDWRHGGGELGRHLRLLLRVRRVDARGAFVSHRDGAIETRNWTELYDGRAGFCFFGHHAQLAPPAPRRAPHALGLDTGCCFGGRLTAAVIAEGQRPIEASIVSVPARKRYAEPRGDGEPSIARPRRLADAGVGFEPSPKALPSAGP